MAQRGAGPLERGERQGHVEVLGADGQPIEAQASLNDPSDVIKTVPKAWWTAAWESMELAGDPPPPDEEPADLIDGTATGGQQ